MCHDIKAGNLLYTLSSHPGFHIVPLTWSTGIVVLVRKAVIFGLT